MIKPQHKETILYKSLHDFEDIFSAPLKNVLTKTKSKVLHAAWIETPLGAMVAIADKKQLYFLEFADWRGLTREINQLRKETGAAIFIGEAPPLVSIKNELESYFQRKLKRFKTSLFTFGTPFQKAVWSELKKVSYGDTRSYCDIAVLLGKPTAYRAVANANGKNRFAIIIPCHRIINHNGQLGGYGGGLSRKIWLLDHEQEPSS